MKLPNWVWFGGVLFVLAFIPKSAFPDPSSPEDTTIHSRPTPAIPDANPSAPNLCAATAQPIGAASSHLAQISNLSSRMAAWIPSLTEHFAARPFPEIHQQARLARVPVIMFHDILPEKQVFFDVTPAEFEADLQLIQRSGLTPITLDQLVEHLSTGKPLPDKPILLSFDDGYAGHYTHVYPLLKKYHYPAVFAIYPDKVGTTKGRSSLTWDQLREMAADPLVTIASHSYTHPPDLRVLPDDRLREEIVESKRVLETQLGISIHHFIYPEGKYDARVERWVQMAGYHSALTMNDEQDLFAGESDDLLSIDRIGQSRLADVIEQAYGGPPLPAFDSRFNFSSEVRIDRRKVNNVPLIFASGGRPATIHAKSRYQVWEIAAHTPAVAAVDGGFFSLEFLDSNDMLGPVYSQSTGKFVPASDLENKDIKGRPLVLISPTSVKYVPYDPERHNSLEGIQAEMPGVTDAFVAAAWLVRDGQPQPRESFGKLYGFDASRDRAFWGINQAGQPVVGVSGDYVDSIAFGAALSKAGLRDAVMLDSGASASLSYKGQSMMSYQPRPVPHIVVLLPPLPGASAASGCTIVSQTRKNE